MSESTNRTTESANASNGADKPPPLDAGLEADPVTETDADSAPGDAAAVAEKRSEAVAAFTARLGEVVALLMTMPRYRHMALQDLDWMVLAPLMRDQLAVATANARESGAKQLAGAVLTARVSEAVDVSIREQIKAGVFPVRLKPGDWTSGEIVWLLDVIAPTKPIATRILSEVSRARFKGQKVLVHPIVAGLVDKDVLRKVGGEGGEAA
ncbi:toxin-activating lysine-acyltransferase [Microbaculum marinisediminis]|uniref:RTX toxin-activating lysine-acyltransferase n=1 Tax=Microbaculum marinisediminis TaxID=2931392 RepID=A0AAW5R653_9HYPH|nr:toxin-activating lysine-acyltransferase [Microbaculum sp. A6E488]MCT8974000.1 toxin-activating lysine-acyltransferase [Microbaculum sp. A6E488]